MIFKNSVQSDVHLAEVLKKKKAKKTLKKKSLNKPSIKYGENVERYFITVRCSKGEFSIEWPKLNTETYIIFSLMDPVKIQFLSRLEKRIEQKNAC